MNIKKTGKKYKIELDDGTIIKTYDDVIIKYGILYKKDIDEDLIKKINDDNEYYEEYNKCLNYINKKLRSEKEIRKYLNDSKNKESIIKKLKEINLINDLNYTKAFIADRVNLSNDGPLKIKKDLLKQDILEDLINDELNKVDNDIIKNKLEKLVNKRVKNNKYSLYKLKNKILNELINLGYEKEDILYFLNGVEINNRDLIQKEYDKLYKKYNTKYDNNKLDYIINSKLYMKGFTKEEIDTIKKANEN